jgi:glycosyltransferase involved in cell wall biosynthesis
MRSFLYLTPYFPPMRRVGALRPLKFARHLPAHGWTPVVLCDLRASDAVDVDALEAVPTAIPVRYDYARRSAATWAAFDRTERAPQVATRSTSLATPWFNPEWVPLGEHSPNIPFARRALERALDAHPDCEAIVVNADPYAAMLVATTVGARRGLPVIHDLRDPWAPCELRRPRRPALQRRIVDALERRCVEGAARVVLNNAQTRDAYVRHYDGVVDAARFTFIRNHGDAALIDGGHFAPPDAFTILFLGGLRRFVEGDVFLDALAILRSQGVDASSLQLRVMGAVPDEVRARAVSLGVADMVSGHPFVPYREVGGFMHAADLLIAFSRSAQRIPAKLYDYVLSRRPILSVGDNPEAAGMLEHVAGTRVCGPEDAAGVAAAIVEAMAAGRQRDVARDATPFTSATAAGAMARVLNDATGAS